MIREVDPNELPTGVTVAREPGWRTLLNFYTAFLHDLRRNLVMFGPVLGALVLVWAASAAVLASFESGSGGPVKDYWAALYTTSVAVTTLGIGDVVPQTVGGRILVVVDALMGLALLGVIVNVFNVSFDRD